MPTATSTATPGADTVSALVRDHLRSQVVAIDRDGLYPGDFLRRLGAAGGLVGPGRTDDLGPALRTMAEVSETCGTTGFCLWCQNTSAWYLANTANSGLRERHFAAVGAARRLGGTALSNPMKHYARFEPLKLAGTPVPGGYAVSGTLPWVSNLGPDHAFGLVFATPAGTAAAYVTCDRPGLELKRTAAFAALEGTATFALRFDRFFVAESELLAEPAEPFVRQVQAGFLLLQLGLGFGLIRGAQRDLIGCELPAVAEEIAAAVAPLAAQASALATTPLEPAPDYLQRVLRLRLATAELALRATQTAAVGSGARGFLATAAPQRRLREALFFSILTPSLRHLHRLLATD